MDRNRTRNYHITRENMTTEQQKATEKFLKAFGIKIKSNNKKVLIK